MTRELRTAVIVAAVVVLVTTTATTWYLARPKTDPTPRLDAPIEEVAKYVAGEHFAKLPFERQRLFMTMLDERKDELDRAYRDRKLDSREYRKGLEYAWFGEQLPRMEKYHGLPSEEQAAYIDQRLDKKDGKGGKKKKEDGEAGVGSTADALAESAPADGLVEVKRDEQTEKDIPKTWPPEWREKWKKYREALKDRREEREEEKEAGGQSGT
jgi:hypothetical protein